MIDGGEDENDEATFDEPQVARASRDTASIRQLKDKGCGDRQMR